MEQYVVTSDWHISSDNLHLFDVADNKSLVCQLFAVCKEKKINDVIIPGDLFLYRKAQPLGVIDTAKAVMRGFAYNNINVWIIPGNHDKIDQNVDLSYLCIIEDLDGINVINKPFKSPYGTIFFLPYYPKNKIKEILNSYDLDDGINILICHMDITGSIPNVNTYPDENDTSPADIPGFDLVINGHYHNRYTNKNIVNVGSIAPANFGENNNKGYSILSIDKKKAWIDHYTLEFKGYHTETLTYNKIDDKAIIKAINSCVKHMKDNYVRIVISGKKEVVDTIDIERFLSIGVKVEMERVLDRVLSEDNSDYTDYSMDDIITEFKLYCSNKGVKPDLGIKYINKLLNMEVGNGR